LLTRWPETCLKDLNKRRINNKDEDFKASVVVASFVFDQNLLTNAKPVKRPLGVRFSPDRIHCTDPSHPLAFLLHQSDAHKRQTIQPDPHTAQIVKGRCDVDKREVDMPIDSGLLRTWRVRRSNARSKGGNPRRNRNTKKRQTTTAALSGSHHQASGFTGGR